MRPTFLFAADEQAAVVESRDTVIVPYDPKKPVKDQHPDKVYLGYDRFLELWEAAKKHRAGEKPAMAAAAYVLSSARYDGRVEEKRVAFTATVEVWTFDDSWVRVPFPFPGVQLSELLLDEKPASFADGVLVVEKPGRHTVTARFEIPLQSGARDFAWGVPETAATRLSLTLDEPRWTARIQPDAGVIERMVDGRKIVTAAIGTTANIRVSLVQAEAAARLVEPAVAQITNAFSVSPAFEAAVAEIGFSFPGAQQEKFSVQLFPRDAVLAGLEAPGLKSWTLREQGGVQVLELTLAEPAMERYKLTVTTERLQAQQLPAERSALWFGATAKRMERVLEMYSSGGADVQPVPAPALRRTERGLKAKNGWEPIGSWAGDEALKYVVSLSQAKHEAEVDYVYQVNRRKIELIASMKLHAKGAQLFETSLTVPAGFDVQAVDSERMQDWWRDGQKLRVRFKGATTETTPLVVYLVREYAAAPQQLEVQPLALDGFAKVTGQAVIAAHKGVDTVLKLAENGDADLAKEVDAAKAAKDFQILPPLERKRGFAFKKQAFSGQVTLAPLPVKQSVTWMMHAQAFESWLSLSMKAQVTLRQGSIEHTSFSLPAALPEAHVTGPEVRETRSRVEGERRIYDVAFQNDVYDTVDFTVDVDLTMTEGKKADGRKVNEIALPAPEFPDSQLTSGYVIADNASEYELKLETEGTEPAQAAVIPWLPSVTKSAGIFRVQPMWKVTLVLERLEKAEVRTAFCAWAEMTTALRQDGTEWHKAVWHLQNRSLQFLPVKLPDGASLVSARVAGQGVRADSGKVNGREAILIPLIKTRPGDVSYDVEVVWRSSRAKLASRDRRDFRDAELIGITVEQTFWSVWLPDSRALTKSDGNMEEVVEVMREVEKARSAVEELKLLNGILADQTVSQEVWANAKRNFDLQCMQVQKQVNTNGGLLLGGRYAGKGSQDTLGKDDEALVQKLADTNTYVGNELAKVAEDNKRIEQRRGGQGGGGGGMAQGALQNGDGQVLSQTANNTNAAQAILFGNNTYAGQTMVNAGTLNNATNGITTLNNGAATNNFATSNSALTVTGNVSQTQAAGGMILFNGGAAQLNSVTANSANSISNAGSNVQSLRWNANPAVNIPSQVPATPGAAPADTRNFYLNDNVVLQQSKTAQGTLKIDKSGAGSLTLSSSLQKFDAVAGKKITKSNSEAAPKKPEAEPNADQGRGLNIARGNRLQQQVEQGQLEMAPQNSAIVQTSSNQLQQAAAPILAQPILPPMAQPAASTPPPPANEPTSQGNPFAGPTPSAAANVAGGVAFGSAGQAPGVVQPTGRLSLTVDFPTEGRVHHFQKVKANAVLELSFSDPKIAQRWTRVAIFAAIAVVLWLLGRIGAARRAAHATRVF